MKPGLKDALTSILIGALVAFFTTFLEGLVDVLQNTENNVLAGAASTTTYALRHIFKLHG